MALRGAFSAEFPRWSCEQLFALATDVESYPRFIPWCKSARVLSEEGCSREVVNHFGAGPAELTFRTRAVSTAPERLEIMSADGPFRRFALTWSFAPMEGGGCTVRADYVIDFRSSVLQGLAHLTIREVERRIVRKFRDRAAEMYGS